MVRKRNWVEFGLGARKKYVRRVLGLCSSEVMVAFWIAGCCHTQPAAKIDETPHSSHRSLLALGAGNIRMDVRSNKVGERHS